MKRTEDSAMTPQDPPSDDTGVESLGDITDQPHGGADADILSTILAAEHLDLQLVQSAFAIAVTAGEDFDPRSHMIEDIATDDLVVGKYLTLTESGTCRAERYGYLSWNGARLKLLPPLWIGERNLAVHWLLLDARPRPLTRDMIDCWLQDLRIEAGVQHETINETLEHINKGSHKCGSQLIAQGEAATDGENAHVEFTVQTERSAGVTREDGSVDFKEVNFVPDISHGTVVAQYRAPTIGEPGFDVYGRILRARAGDEHPVQAGENLEWRNSDSGKELVATADGVCRIDGATVRVLQLLNIEGDIDFQTGNLNFSGEIYIA
ncbi:MAG: hypothetical protein ACI8PG_003607, partial [Planctomycetota bacterium]